MIWFKKYHYLHKKLVWPVRMSSDKMGQMWFMVVFELVRTSLCLFRQGCTVLLDKWKARWLPSCFPSNMEYLKSSYLLNFLLPADSSHSVLVLVEWDIFGNSTSLRLFCMFALCNSEQESRWDILVSPALLSTMPDQRPPWKND